MRDLHHGPRVLLLPNAWDAASARIFESAGFPAIATTSAGVAFSQGRTDGEQLRREEMLEAVARIAAAVRVPVTADLERGYGRTADEVAATARLAIEAGVVGMNLEDSTPEGLAAPEAHAEKVRAAREAGRAAGVPLVINARTDVILFEIGEPAGRLAEAVRRARIYLDAGADCIYVPGASDAETIGRLAREIPGPINILGGPGTPPAPELQRLGVARVSVGSGPARAVLGLVQRIARELADSGTWTAFSDGALSYMASNRLFARALNAAGEPQP